MYCQARAPPAAPKKAKKPAKFETRGAIEEATKRKQVAEGKKGGVGKKKGVQNRYGICLLRIIHV